MGEHRLLCSTHATSYDLGELVLNVHGSLRTHLDMDLRRQGIDLVVDQPGITVPHAMRALCVGQQELLAALQGAVDVLDHRLYRAAEPWTPGETAEPEPEPEVEEEPPPKPTPEEVAVVMCECEPEPEVVVEPALPETEAVQWRHNPQAVSLDAVAKALEVPAIEADILGAISVIRKRQAIAVSVVASIDHALDSPADRVAKLNSWRPRGLTKDQMWRLLGVAPPVEDIAAETAAIQAIMRPTQAHPEASHEAASAHAMLDGLGAPDGLYLAVRIALLVAQP